MSADVWDRLKSLDTPTEYENDTNLGIGELLDMAWTKSSVECSEYSTLTATTYAEPSGKYAKKVFSDGFVEFYELA